ncbi:hypothetical protein NQ317_007780 [Molorchus minor]|uniref:Uncharacterized protein n=1 Tax=Molorchus minor TaxID=1323400 RepID=A0ABQ9JYM4_9CUCU|nr:hypothetical protein NQ317_007780 [Molorchus minor]
MTKRHSWLYVKLCQHPRKLSLCTLEIYLHGEIISNFKQQVCYVLNQTLGVIHTARFSPTAVCNFVHYTILIGTTNAARGRRHDARVAYGNRANSYKFTLAVGKRPTDLLRTATVKTVLCEKGPYGGGSNATDHKKLISSPAIYLQEQQALVKECVESYVNYTVVEEELNEAKKTGSMDEVFEKYCKKWPEIYACFDNVTLLARSCMDDAEKSLEIVKELQEFMCFKGGDRLAKNTILLTHFKEQNNNFPSYGGKLLLLPMKCLLLKVV